MMLMIFGVIMILGNFLFGSFLQKNVLRTTVLFPVAYAAAYLLIYFAGGYFLPMIVMILLWGIVHSGGLVVSQSWLMTEAQTAPEFGNSLFVSFTNLGITIGASVGGWFIGQWGIHQLIWSGVGFALLAFLLIAVKIKWYSASQ
ncbi:hypothetical protein SAMN04487970_1001310 [Paenibacillus tianmuensis]|uniref:Major Facilitator Superfamily protein n=1 Tax=Paenibacillus tianmuensis TaxID=624147 RepID=A0A1G4P9K2_9BACL|nr:hypothetical protein SAMN04487970_1001310 [Paenibacillus tianmuensis]